jgi:hypothetical protein
MSGIASEVLGHLLEACDLDVADKISFKETVDDSYNCSKDEQLAHHVLSSVSHDVSQINRRELWNLFLQQAISYYESRAPLTKLEKRVIEKLLGSFDQLPSLSSEIKTMTLSDTQTLRPESNSAPAIHDQIKADPGLSTSK